MIKCHHWMSYAMCTLPTVLCVPIGWICKRCTHFDAITCVPSSFGQPLFIFSRDSKWFVISRYHLEESVKWRIIGRLEAGQSITETATCLNISRQTVSKLWKQFQNDGTVVRRPGQGRKRMTTASEDRYLALTARRNRKATARQLSSELAAATGAVASRQTIYRRLNEKDLYARKPRVCVLLSSQKKRDRFNWCKEHQNWTEHQWSHVLFTDESRFSLTGDSKRVYIWGVRNTK
ncbi:transposable element Tcb2 transposase [Trichonephila clavipes]|nr:transposable element Tcb2 transposase [Trichonephila clavipes]